MIRRPESPRSLIPGISTTGAIPVGSVAFAVEMAFDRTREAFGVHVQREEFQDAAGLGVGILDERGVVDLDPVEAGLALEQVAGPLVLMAEDFVDTASR